MSIAKDLVFILILLILFFVLRRNISLRSELFQQRENFIKTLSHDLRVSTLAQIRGLDLLQRKFSQEGLISDIEESCKFSLEMINMLLNTYRYENGEQILNYEVINFTDLLAFECRNLWEHASKKGIDFSLNMKNFMPVYLDKTEMLKALYYLLSTAIFYCKRDSKIEISAKKINKDIVVSIIYSGIPLSEEECNRMFSNNPRFSTVGHGIKMYMCKKIIEFHGGNIFVNNIDERTNLFGFTLGGVNDTLL